MLSPAQCRAARALLDVSQTAAAKRAGVGRRTLVEFENRTRIPHDRVLRDIREAFEHEGLVFLDAGASSGAGVRFKDPDGEKFSDVYTPNLPKSENLGGL